MDTTQQIKHSKAFLNDQLKQKIIEWKERYGRKRDGSVDLNFTSVREQMFLTLGGYNFDDFDNTKWIYLNCNKNNLVILICRNVIFIRGN